MHFNVPHYVWSKSKFATKFFSPVTISHTIFGTQQHNDPPTTLQLVVFRIPTTHSCFCVYYVIRQRQGREWRLHDLYRTGFRERVFANNIVTATALVTPTLLGNLHSNVVGFARFDSSVVPIPKKYYNYFAAAPIQWKWIITGAEDGKSPQTYI